MSLALADGFAVDDDLVDARIDENGQAAADLAVDGDAALFDELLGRPAAGDAVVCQELVQADFGGVVGHGRTDTVGAASELRPRVADGRWLI